MQNKKKVSFIILVILLIIFILGITIGDIRVVLEKAVNVCLECIGIG